MPYQIQKVRQGKYVKVINKKTGHILAKRTSVKKAKKQIRLLNAIDHGFKPRRKKH